MSRLISDRTKSPACCQAIFMCRDDFALPQYVCTERCRYSMLILRMGARRFDDTFPFDPSTSGVSRTHLFLFMHEEACIGRRDVDLAKSPCQRSQPIVARTSFLTNFPKCGPTKMIHSPSNRVTIVSHFPHPLPYVMMSGDDALDTRFKYLVPVSSPSIALILEWWEQSHHSSSPVHGYYFCTCPKIRRVESVPVITDGSCFLSSNHQRETSSVWSRVEEAFLAFVAGWWLIVRDKLPSSFCATGHWRSDWFYVHHLDHNHNNHAWYNHRTSDSNPPTAFPIIED